MSKMKELSQVLDEMVSCGERLIRAANILRETFSTAPEAPSAPNPVAEEPATLPVEEPVKPPAEKTYTYVEVRKVCSAKSNAGFSDRVKALIGKYGAGRLSAVREEDYNALMAELEVIQ